MENGNPWKIPFDPVKCGATFGVAILKHLKHLKPSAHNLQDLPITQYRVSIHGLPDSKSLEFNGLLALDVHSESPQCLAEHCCWISAQIEAGDIRRR